jgi:N-acetylglucosamine-6-phosphate deacetylase
MKLYCKNVITGGEIIKNQCINIENKIITSISPLQEGQVATIENICPALVDIHINGGEDYHFTQAPTEETLRDIENAALKNGVAYTLPTLITSSFENIKKGIAAIKNYKKANPDSGILGMHLEGPFLSVKKRGAHLEKYIQKPNNELIEAIINESDGAIKMITIAPENFTEKQIKTLVDSGIVVSLGHSDCSYKTALSSMKLGVNLVTHLFNAMSALGHREPGLVGATLINPNVFAPIILDDVHVDKNVAKLAFEAKKGKLFLISDALFQNHKKQNFVWEEFNATLTNGNYMNTDGNLAGATISMADAVRNAVKWFDISLEKAIYMGTELPAIAISETRKIGKIAVGYEAKLCTFESDFENVNIFNNN